MKTWEKIDGIELWGLGGFKELLGFESYEKRIKKKEISWRGLNLSNLWLSLGIYAQTLGFSYKTCYNYGNEVPHLAL